MTAPQRLVLLWILMTLCMILHFDYDVSGIFYRVDVVAPDANGVIPPVLIVIRLLFNIVPMAFAVALTFFAGKLMRIVSLVVAVLYALAHAENLVGVLRLPQLNPSQAMLLSFTLALSLLQIGVSYRWWKTPAA